jgi:hypothetical protein
MAGNPKRRLALDASFLLDLAEGKDFAHDFKEVFQARGYDLLVPPTAAGELDVLGTYGGEPQKSYANRALEKLPAWGFQPFWLSSTHLAIAEQFTNRLMALRLVPEDEWNDGMILGETSVADIPVLVTSDKHLLDIDEDALLLAFQEADLLPVHPAHPKRLLRALR